MFKLKILRKKFTAQKIRKIGNKVIEKLGNYENIKSIEIVCGFLKVKLLKESLINEKSLKKLANVWKNNDHILIEIYDLKPQEFVNCYELFNNEKNFINSVSYQDVTCDLIQENNAVINDNQN